MTPAEKKAFIARVAPMAQQTQQKYGVPASVTIAQAILESADRKGTWGASILAAKYNNFFGIKHNSRLDDGYCELLTTEHVGKSDERLTDEFAVFKDAQRSFDAHGRLLGNSPRYQPAMADADDALAFVGKLGPASTGGCGYSTRPEYAKRLADLVTQYHLMDYDAKPPRKAAEAKP